MNEEVLSIQDALNNKTITAREAATLLRKCRASSSLAACRKLPAGTLPPLATHCPVPWQSLTLQKAWRARYVSRTPDPDLPHVCVRECGGGGDCLFYAISTGLYLSEHTPEEFAKESAKSLMASARCWLARSITADNVEFFLKSYLQEYANSTKLKYTSWPTHPQTWNPSDFGGTVTLQIPATANQPRRTETVNYPPKYALMNPELVKVKISGAGKQITEEPLSSNANKKQIAQHNKACLVRAVIQVPGYKYQGDDISLRFLTAYDNAQSDIPLAECKENPIYQKRIGFVILSTTGQINCELIEDEQRPAQQFMILYNVGSYHWQLIGMSTAGTKQVRTLFSRNQLPAVVKNLYAQDCLLADEKLDETHPMYIAPSWSSYGSSAQSYASPPSASSAQSYASPPSGSSAQSYASPPSGSSGWNCSQCTFENEAQSSQCMMCGAPKSEVADSDTWDCSLCTFQNLADDPRCGACGIAKESPEESAALSSLVSSLSSRSSKQKDWACQLCTVLNDPSSRMCRVCETPQERV